VFGAFSAILCAWVWWTTREPVWAALARTAAWFNVVNLIPVSILDGAGVLPVLNAGGCIVIGTAGLALWQFSSDGVFLLLAAFAILPILRGSQKQDGSQKHSYGLTAGFATVLTALATILWLMPKVGKWQ